jgi:hypothetical protein
VTAKCQVVEKSSSNSCEEAPPTAAASTWFVGGFGARAPSHCCVRLIKHRSTRSISRSLKKWGVRKEKVGKKKKQGIRRRRNEIKITKKKKEERNRCGAPTYVLVRIRTIQCPLVLTSIDTGCRQHKGHKSKSEEDVHYVRLQTTS